MSSRTPDCCSSRVANDVSAAASCRGSRMSLCPGGLGKLDRF
jgi:hypothetical protein